MNILKDNSEILRYVLNQTNINHTLKFDHFNGNEFIFISTNFIFFNGRSFKYVFVCLAPNNQVPPFTAYMTVLSLLSFFKIEMLQTLDNNPKTDPLTLQDKKTDL